MEEVKFIIEQLEMLAKNRTIKCSISVIKDSKNTAVHIVGDKTEMLLAMSSALEKCDELKALAEASIAFNGLFKSKDVGGGNNNSGAAGNRGDGTLESILG